MIIDFDTDLKRDIEDLERILNKLEGNEGWKFRTADMADAVRRMQKGLNQLNGCFSESMEERGVNELPGARAKAEAEHEKR